MITGTWLARIGRAFARKETFERMIAPAIADLQLEGPDGCLVRWRHYMGIMAVFAHALLQDLRVEISFVLSREARRAVWTPAAVWFAFFVALLTFMGLRYNLPSDLPLNGIWVPALTSTGLAAAVAAVIPGMIAAAFYLTRRSSSRRSIILVTLMAASLTIAFATMVRPCRMSADRTLHDHIHEKIVPANAWSFRDRLDAEVTWWRDIQIGVQVIPFAFLGILLAGCRGWGVALGVFAYYGSWMLVVVVWTSLFHRMDQPSLVAQGWRELAFNFAALIVLFIVDRISHLLTADKSQRDELRTNSMFR